MGPVPSPVAVLDLRLDHQEVDIAVRACLPPCVRAEQDHSRGAPRGPDYQPIRFESAGRVDSIRGGIRNTFDFIPDAPIASVLFELQGGKKGLLVNSRDICAKTYRAKVRYTAHNGDTLTARPKLVAGCGRGRRSRGHRGVRGRHRR